MKSIILIFLLLTYSLIYAQKEGVFHKQFTQDDGIQIETINDIVSDANGFIWLGGGIEQTRLEILGETAPITLQRFNGYSFHSIPFPNKDISRVVHMHKRANGDFYIITKLGLYLFDPITITFKTILIHNDSGLSNIFNYNNKEYIITSDDLEVIVNTIDSNFNLKEEFRFTTSVNKILIDSGTKFIPFKDYVILSDDNFPITFLDWDGNILKVIDPEDFDNERPGDVQKKWIDEHWLMQEKQYLMLYNNPQVYCLDPVKMSLDPVTSIPPISCVNSKVINDSLGNNIILTFFNKTLDIRTFQDQGISEAFFTSPEFEDINNFNIISENLTKDLWFTTSSSLNYIKLPPAAITNHLVNTQFRAMASINDSIHLIASEDKGWYSFNSKKNSISPYILYHNDSPYEPNSSRNIIKDDSILWSTDFNGGILEIDIVKHKVKKNKYYPATCLVRPTDSTLVYGTNRYNLMEFNINTKTHHPLVNTDTLSINDIIWRKEDNQILASTNKGLLTYHMETKEHTFYNSPSQLEDPYLLLIDYHPTYGYLLGSRKGHLIAFDAATKSFKTLYRDELEAAIATVLFDDQENWWINTFDGYVSYNPLTQEQHRYAVKDGFSNNESNRTSALKTKDGFLIGSIKGLNFFKPEDLIPEVGNEALLPLKIKTYNHNKQNFESNFMQLPFTPSQKIILPAENRTLEVDFGLTNVDITRNERYQYRLNNQEWIPLGNMQSILFPSLSPGNYNLEIEALDFSGKKIGESLVLPINSKNFFYKTWWFFMIILLLITSILLWMLKQSQVHKKLQESFSQGLMQSQEQERSRIAKDLHDGLGQQLTLIKQRLQAKGDTEIVELTHNTLEEVRSISRGLYPTIIRQLGLSGSIEQLLYELDEQTQLFVSVDIDDIDAFFDEQASLHIYRFIQENVSNVMKHAFAKALSLSISHENNTVQLRIQDNGKGFDLTEKQKNNSLGLKTLEERIRILGGALSIESEENKGTLVIVQIPIK